jgi:mannose-6-phosphate isomerase
LSPIPLFPRPLLVERPWGGSSLSRWGRDVAPDARCGESWDLGTVAGCDSVLVDSPFERLSDAAAALDGAWLGCAEGAFPLLVKLIDARETLSVQVHPATSGPGWAPKNECWVVLEAQEGAFLYAGTTTDIPADILVQRLNEGDLGVLQRIPVVAGDVVVIPAGTIHAITAGLLIAEIQQCSDTTYRVYDWGRVGLDGRPRQLHLTESVACLDSRPRTDLKPQSVSVAPGRELLCATPWFALERIRPASPVHLVAREGFQILQVLDGEGTLRWNGGHRVLARGACVLLPSRLDAVLEAGTWLRSFVPDYASEIEAPVLAAGGTSERARSLTAGTFD